MNDTRADEWVFSNSIWKAGPTGTSLLGATMLRDRGCFLYMVALSMDGPERIEEAAMDMEAV